MHKYLTMILLALCGLLGAIEPHFMSDPAISPDGNTVCFCYQSDLWTVPFSGGEAKRITVSDANDRGPMWSPDGRWIAFNSDRGGRGNIWLIPSGGGQARQLCEEGVSVIDWYPDGKALLTYGSFAAHESGFYKLVIDDVRPLEIVKFGDSYGSLDREAKAIIFNRRGDPFRERYVGSDNGELWRYDIAKNTFTQLTHTSFTERYPVCSMQRDAVYYVASDGDVFQLFRVVNGDYAHPEQLTRFDVWSPRDLGIARANERVVYEYFDQIGGYDPATGRADVIPVQINQDCIGLTEEKTHLRNEVKAFAASPDGQFIVFAGRYDLFAVPVKGGEVRQITRDQAGIDGIEVLEDNHTIYFSKYVEGVPTLYRTDIRHLDKVEEVGWTKGKYIDWFYSTPQNGLAVFFSEGEDRYQCALMDSTGARTNIDGQFWGDSEIDPENEWLFFSRTDPEFRFNALHLYDLKHKQDHTLLGGEDWMSGLAFGTDRRTAFFTRNGDILRLDLAPKPVDYQQQDHWKEILAGDDKEDKPGKPGGPKPDEAKQEEHGLIVDFDGLENRQFHIIAQPGSSFIVHVIDDSTFYYVNRFNDESTLRKAKYNGEEDEEVYSFGKKDVNPVWNEGANAFYYLQDDMLFTFDPNRRNPEAVRYETRYSYDDLKLNQDIFRKVWLEFGRGFYDPNMHGQDWNKLWKRFAPYTNYFYSPDDLEMAVDELIGEVNASHTGFYPRREGGRRFASSARIGAELDYGKPRAKGIAVLHVYPDCVLAQVGGIKAGDILMSVDGQAITADKPVQPLFEDKVNEEITLVFNVGDSLKTVKVTGLGWGEEYNLWYREWTEQRRQMVDKLSNGRIGYLHIEGMDNPSYEKFLDDLYFTNRDKDALIIDVRDNGGGHTHDRIIEVLTKKQYGYSTDRGIRNARAATPNDTWQKPTAVLINENSASDAEIFPIIFKELGLGKVIGMPTGGAVIGTGEYEFMDGSSMRMPGNGWYTMKGENMEGLGAAPDIEVDQTPQQIIDDDDTQLKAAVQELLRELKQ